jgi:hypothetical protein
MPPILSKPAKVSKLPPRAQFFAPQSNLCNLDHRDYTNIQRQEVNPQNPPRASTNDNAITTALPSTPDYNSDHEMADSPAPTFANTILTEAEKIEAIKKWAANKAKHTKKKRDKNSHVYYYIKREVVDSEFYTEIPSGPLIY